MALTSEATTLWRGELQSGSGTTSLDSSEAAEFPVTWAGRTEGETGRTNPEELIAAAHSSCYSMAFSNILTKAGTPPESIQVNGEKITTYITDQLALGELTDWTVYLATGDRKTVIFNG